MGRKSSINSRNKVIGVRVTNDGFEQFKSLTPELRDKFNKLLRQTADGLLNKFIKIVVNKNNIEINVNKNNTKINVNKNNDQEIVANKNNNTEIVVNKNNTKINVNKNNDSHEIVVNKNNNTEIVVNKNNTKINVNKNNDSHEIVVNENNIEINVNKNNDQEIVANKNSHEMTEEEFDTFCAELDADQDDRKINTADALKIRRSRLNKSTKNDSLHSRYMKDLEDKELMKVVLEDI